MTHPTLKDWQVMWKAGEFKDFTKKTYMFKKDEDECCENACKFGWWDWFTKDKCLLGKTKKIAGVLTGIKNPKLLDCTVQIKQNPGWRGDDSASFDTITIHLMDANNNCVVCLQHETEKSTSYNDEDFPYGAVKAYWKFHKGNEYNKTSYTALQVKDMLRAVA